MTQTAKLTPSDGRHDAFGSSVAISGNTVVAGTIGSRKGYVFVEPPGGWADMTQTARLTVPGGFTGPAVGISGDTVVSGAPQTTIGSNFEQGAAYIFVKPTNGWTDTTPTARLTASDGAAGDWLGYAVAISGNRVLTGAPLVAIGSNPAQGASYTFIKPSTGWKTTSHFNAKVIASDGAKDDEFGGSVATSGTILLFGAPGATSQHGAAYLFGP